MNELAKSLGLAVVARVMFTQALAARATTIWVWERTFDPRSDFAGSVMHRPACAEAVGVANLDLNRAALEITALQQTRPQVRLLHSVTASVWEGGRYRECLGQLYTALSFTGLKIGFLTERQLETGTIPDAPVVFVPAISHFSQTALAALCQFKGRVVPVGEGGLLTHDELGRPNTSRLTAERIPFGSGVTLAHDLHRELMDRLSGWHLRPTVELIGSDQQPAWGVAWRSAATRDGTVVNLCNYRKAAATVTVTQGGQTISTLDVLAGERMDGPITLSPREVRRLRLKPTPNRKGGEPSRTAFSR